MKVHCNLVFFEDCFKKTRLAPQGRQAKVKSFRNGETESSTWGKKYLRVEVLGNKGCFSWKLCHALSINKVPIFTSISMYVCDSTAIY